MDMIKRHCMKVLIRNAGIHVNRPQYVVHTLLTALSYVEILIFVLNSFLYIYEYNQGL